MSALDPVAAMRRIDTDQPEVFAMEVAGHVSAADVENLYGLLEGEYILHPQIDLLLRVVDHHGIDWSDVERGTIEETRAHAARHIRRCAIVGESTATAALRRIIRHTEAELREYPAELEAEAWAWLGARPVVDD